MFPPHVQANAPTCIPAAAPSVATLTPQTWIRNSRFPPALSSADLRSCMTVTHTLTSPFQFPPLSCRQTCSLLMSFSALVPLTAHGHAPCQGKSLRCHSHHLLAVI